MKIVRLNDKMWFGKYKGTRIRDIIGMDMYHLESMRSRGLIEFDKKVSEFINDRGRRKSSFWDDELPSLSGIPGGTSSYDDNQQTVQDVGEFEIHPVMPQGVYQGYVTGPFSSSPTGSITTSSTESITTSSTESITTSSTGGIITSSPTGTVYASVVNDEILYTAAQWINPLQDQTPDIGEYSGEFWSGSPNR